MSNGISAALRRASTTTRAGRLIRRAFGLPPAPAPAAPIPAPAPFGAPLFHDTAARPPVADVIADPRPEPTADTMVGEPAQAVPAAPAFPLSAIPALQAAALAAPRGRLDDVIRLLGGRSRPETETPVLPVPDGAQFLARRFGTAEGARDYRLYIPALDSPPRGLLLMLHGCTQTPEDFALGTGMNAVAEAAGLIVAYPEQPQAQNANRCWNWFRPEDQRRGAGEPALLAGLAETLAAEFAVPRSRLFVAGLSAGGAMAAVLGEAYPDLFAAIGVHSGVPCGSARDARSALAAMRGAVAASGPGGVEGPPTIVFQGDADTTVHPANATQLVIRAVGEAASGRWDTRTDGGRSVTRSTTRSGPEGRTVELWMIAGAGHAWSGGNPTASYAEAEGPDASAEMVRFFLSDQADPSLARAAE